MYDHEYEIARKTQKYAFRGALVCAAIIAALMIVTIVAEAKEKNSTVHPVNGWFTDENGNSYYYQNGKAKTGYFKIGNRNYYGHKTGTKEYPKGSVTKGQFRIKGGKWYAYGGTGARYEKSVYSYKGRQKRLQLDIGKDHAVRYVYQTNMTRRGYRYSTRLKRWQTYEN